MASLPATQGGGSSGAAALPPRLSELLLSEWARGADGTLDGVEAPLASLAAQTARLLHMALPHAPAVSATGVPSAVDLTGLAPADVLLAGCGPRITLPAPLLGEARAHVAARVAVGEPGAGLLGVTPMELAASSGVGAWAPPKQGESVDGAQSALAGPLPLLMRLLAPFEPLSAGTVGAALASAAAPPLTAGTGGGDGAGAAAGCSADEAAAAAGMRMHVEELDAGGEHRAAREQGDARMEDDAGSRDGSDL